MLQSNPLSQFFRQPAIHIRLPSGGKFYPVGSINMPPNGELPVLPMTAVDEITYRTPDALFNGSAVVSVIQSCVPSIKDAWQMPSQDIDAVMIAIRIASFGHGMDITTRCPACNHSDEVTVDLRAVNDMIHPGDYNKNLELGDLKFHFKPMSYKEINANNQVQFDQQQALRIVNDDSVEDAVKLKQLTASMKIINDLTIRTIAQSIHTIQTSDAIVTEFNYILEFLTNCESKIFNRLRDYVIDLKQSSEIKPVDISCVECTHTYKQPFTLDMTSFFGNAS